MYPKQKRIEASEHNPKFPKRRYFAAMIDYQKKRERSKTLSLDGVHYCNQKFCRGGKRIKTGETGLTPFPLFL